jgi:GxxExxY protein
MEILYREESYKIIGICMEVHRELGIGFSEVIYKDAMEIEFRRLVFHTSEKLLLMLFTKEFL